MVCYLFFLFLNFLIILLSANQTPSKRAQRYFQVLWLWGSQGPTQGLGKLWLDLEVLAARQLVWFPLLPVSKALFRGLKLGPCPEVYHCLWSCWFISQWWSVQLWLLFFTSGNWFSIQSQTLNSSLFCIVQFACLFSCREVEQHCLWSPRVGSHGSEIMWDGEGCESVSLPQS